MTPLQDALHAAPNDNHYGRPEFKTRVAPITGFVVHDLARPPLRTSLAPVHPGAHSSFVCYQSALLVRFGRPGGDRHE
jgi:hypothetical protein